MSVASILVTGGAGYIGSHTCVELLHAGYDVVVVDNLTNSNPLSLERVQRITGKPLHFYRADLRDREALAQIFAAHRIQTVVHFAGLKAVGESVAMPLAYYQNNLGGTLTLCEVMAQAEVKRIVFSSSATVYGASEVMPIREDFSLSATNPYGRSKLFLEEMLRDLAAADPEWRVALLRYFNPVGAHPSGLIGEDPAGVPNNLMPYIAQVAMGRLEELSVFGNDYPTPDGSGVRDYIHVVDLAEGHVRALAALARQPGVFAVNLGTGRGYSVFEMIHAFEKASGRKIRYRVVGRRPGDIACCYADPSLAKAVLGWRAQRGIEAMCADTWRWQTVNPDGYGGAVA